MRPVPWKPGGHPPWPGPYQVGGRLAGARRVGHAACGRASSKHRYLGAIRLERSALQLCRARAMTPPACAQHPRGRGPAAPTVGVQEEGQASVGAHVLRVAHNGADLQARGVEGWSDLCRPPCHQDNLRHAQPQMQGAAASARRGHRRGRDEPAGAPTMPLSGWPLSGRKMATCGVEGRDKRAWRL